MPGQSFEVAGPRRRLAGIVAALAFAAVLAAASPSRAQAPATGETVAESICRLIEVSARAQQLPVEFVTRLIWQESSFRPDVISRAGARGVAQFMPGTARERGLADPFDPEQAIPAAASLIADLRRQFGNLGLAAAAYNGGPTRVTAWLSGRGGLPIETRDYVFRITGRSAEDWMGERDRGAAPAAPVAPAVPAAPARPAATGAPAEPSAPASPPPVTEAKPEATCLTIVASLRRGAPSHSVLAEGAAAPWGVQLAGNFSKAVAIAAFERSRARLASVIGNQQPMVLGSRLRTRGRTSFYRVRLPAQSRGEANALCNRIHAAGGACVVLRS